jgi:hypothetical protein
MRQSGIYGFGIISETNTSGKTTWKKDKSKAATYTGHPCVYK